MPATREGKILADKMIDNCGNPPGAGRDHDDHDVETKIQDYLGICPKCQNPPFWKPRVQTSSQSLEMQKLSPNLKLSITDPLTHSVTD